ncbi:MAG: DUF983 domain-containing protein [Planctomycetota bacterium]
MRRPRASRIVWRSLRLRCPACGTGHQFASLLRMHARCATCQFRFEREQGYFIGSIYVNYLTTGLIMVSGCFTLRFAFGIPIGVQLVPWTLFGLIFPLLFFRYARSLFMAADLILFPPER